MNQSGTDDQSGTESAPPHQIASTHRSRSRLPALSWLPALPWLPALLCGGIFLLCVLLVWPYLESGIMDDWSIVRTAHLLAETGHIHYNGWEAPMLGWPLYVAAACFRLFGFSFTIARITMIVESLLTVLLLQRTFVRSGISEWNSVLGTLTVALSPIFLMSAVAFMTDIPALLAVLLCFFACLRALQAETTGPAAAWRPAAWRPAAWRPAAAWLCFAALSNAVLGTTRQIAWLGLLVIVPSALWLLRRNRRVVAAGAAAWLAGVGFMIAALLWLNRQPYILPEHLLLGAFSRKAVEAVGIIFIRVGFDTVLFSLPVVVAFAASFRSPARHLYRRLAASASMVLLAFVELHRFYGGPHSLAPFLLFEPLQQTLENTFTSTPMPIWGPIPAPLPHSFRLGLTVVILLASFVLLAALLNWRARPAQPDPGDAAVSRRDLLVLGGPFAIAYFALLLPRGIFIFTVDRYVLLLLPFVVLFLLRFYQSRLGSRLPDPRLPAFCLVPLAIIGLYSVATLHDTFVVYRANLACIDELRAAGVPRTAIDGGMAFNRTTQLLATDVTYTPGMRMPDRSIYRGPRPRQDVGPCAAYAPELAQTPVVRPLYGVAYPGSPCVKVAAFAPVHFRTWLPPFHREADVVRYVVHGQLAGPS